MKIFSRILVAMAVLGLLGFLVFEIYSCCTKVKRKFTEHDARIEREYKGFISYMSSEHKIKKMFNYSEKTKTKNSNWRASGDFFFLLYGDLSAGGSSQEKENNQMWITFAWENSDNTYILTKIPLTKARVRIVSSIKIPTVSFHLHQDQALRRTYDVNGLDDRAKMSHWFYNDSQTFFEKHLAYVFITVKEKDWPVDIQLPFNNPSDPSIFKKH